MSHDDQRPGERLACGTSKRCPRRDCGQVSGTGSPSCDLFDEQFVRLRCTARHGVLVQPQPHECHHEPGTLPAVLVGSQALFTPHSETPEHIRLANGFRRFMELAETIARSG